MPVERGILRRRGLGEVGEGRTRRYYDGKVLEAVLERTRHSRSQAVYEVHVADLVIDEETGDILEIHILLDKHEAPQLIKTLKNKGILHIEKD